MERMVRITGDMNMIVDAVVNGRMLMPIKNSTVVLNMNSERRHW
jgi:hypothetical protein